MPKRRDKISTVPACNRETGSEAGGLYPPASDPIEGDGVFIKLDDSILESTRLTPCDKLVYCAILCFDFRGVADPTAGQLASRCAVSVRQIGRAIRNLEKVGLVARQGRRILVTAVELSRTPCPDSRTLWPTSNSDTMSEKKDIMSDGSDTMAVFSDMVSDTKERIQTRKNTSNPPSAFVEANPASTGDFVLTPPQPNGSVPENTTDAVAGHVYRRYCSEMGRDPVFYKLTPKRKAMLRARAAEALLMCRLKNPRMTPIQQADLATKAMILCIAAIRRSSFHTGENPSGKKYLDLSHIFGSAERMEKWMGCES